MLLILFFLKQIKAVRTGNPLEFFTKFVENCGKVELLTDVIS
jgi:hypothetical protein